jgi:hypothetical protein
MVNARGSVPRLVRDAPIVVAEYDVDHVLVTGGDRRLGERSADRGQDDEDEHRPGSQTARPTQRAARHDAEPRVA